MQFNFIPDPNSTLSEAEQMVQYGIWKEQMALLDLIPAIIFAFACVLIIIVFIVTHLTRKEAGKQIMEFSDGDESAGEY